MLMFLLGLLLVAAGGLAVYVACPPQGRDTQSWLSGRGVSQAIYPSLCLALVTFGLAIIVSQLPGL